MWTKTIAVISGILAGVAFAISNHYASVNNRYLELLYLFVGIALYALCVLLALIELVRWWHGRRFVRRPNPTDQPAVSPPTDRNFKSEFGVYWDAELNLYCPECRTPLIPSIKNLVYQIDIVNNTIPLPLPVPLCLKCNEVITLYDDDGNRLTLSEAKRLLSPIKRKADIESPKTKPPKPQTADAETIKLRDAREKLQTFKEHLPEGDIGEEYAQTYYQALKQIQQDTGRDMSRFILPLDALQPRTGQKGLYCHKPIFLIVIDYAINSLKGDDSPNQPVPTVPHPSGHDLLDEAKINILKLLADPENHPTQSWIAVALQLHPVKVQFHLGELKKHGYVVIASFHSITGEADYQLTQKARAFLIERKLID